MFKQFLKKIVSKTGKKVVPTGSIVMDTRQLRTFLYVSRLYPLIQNVPGDIVECGVGKGRTFLYLSYLSFQEGKNRRVWGFDSFEGFPEPSPEDASKRNPKKGEWAGVSPADITAILRTGGLRSEWINEYTKLVSGFFNTSLSQYNKKPIAFLHVDVDLYDSYLDVLNTLYPYVSKGGVVLFDEYGDAQWPGAKKAVDEFLKKYPHDLMQEIIGGKFYFIKK
jgi:hypothetical protein